MKIKLKDVCTFRSGFQGKSSEGKFDFGIMMLYNNLSKHNDAF